jgi:hypothetical protein
VETGRHGGGGRDRGGGSELQGAEELSVLGRHPGDAAARSSEAGSPQAIQELAADYVAQLEQEILSRSDLASIILNPVLNVYQDERRQIPIKRVILHMRSDIRIQALPAGSPTTGVAPMPFRVSFAYPDPEKAQAVVRVLATRFSQYSVAVNRLRYASRCRGGCDLKSGTVPVRTVRRSFVFAL